jgi:hypothetical protein
MAIAPTSATEHGKVIDWPARVLGGAGLIGLGVAAALATCGGCRELHLVDPKADLLRAHVVDIAEAQVASRPH